MGHVTQPCWDAGRPGPPFAARPQGRERWEASGHVSRRAGGGPGGQRGGRAGTPRAGGGVVGEQEAAAERSRPSPRRAREKAALARSHLAQMPVCVGSWPARDPALDTQPADARFRARPVRRIYKKEEQNTFHLEAEKVLLGAQVCLSWWSSERRFNSPSKLRGEGRATIRFAIGPNHQRTGKPIKNSARISLTRLVVTALTSDVARGPMGCGLGGSGPVHRRRSIPSAGTHTHRPPPEPARPSRHGGLAAGNLRRARRALSLAPAGEKGVRSASGSLRTDSPLRESVGDWPLAITLLDAIGGTLVYR